MSESKGSLFPDERVWYDQFTSTDWVHDTIADSHRAKALRSRKDFWGRARVAFDGCQGWILSALCGFVIALIAYAIDVAESTVFDYKDGYCARAWHLNEKVRTRHRSRPITSLTTRLQNCCPRGSCEDWKSWSQALSWSPLSDIWTDYLVYLGCVVILSCLSCWVALWTKTVVPSAYQLTTLDENLAAVPQRPNVDSGDDGSSLRPQDESRQPSPPMVYYSAAGSGVAEVRVILSGFVLHGFLGLKTIIIKSVALVLSVASGLSLGKEGPYVHIATCVGNIACRLFAKYDRNDAKRREVLSAAAAAGVAVAFGAPLGGVLFGLEEVAYFFPAKTLFRTFFCCIVAALSLKFLNPYGTHKIVMFQVRYLADWEYFELFSFIAVGILGGALGAMFIKASKYWAQSFRRIGVIKSHPLLEVFLVALVTGLLNYWNALVKEPVAKLLLNLASPCDGNDANTDELGLCPKSVDDIPAILLTLIAAFLIKGFLTIITFGIDLLTNMNAYPFLDNKHKPVFTSDLADILTRTRRERVIDISNSPLVPASTLRSKLELLHRAGELDGGLPIVRHDVLVGLIPAPDLEFALDQLDNEQTSLCLMDRVPSIDDDDDDDYIDPTDFAQYIDPAPVSLDVRSPVDLVYECFVKLGLRYICASKDGQFKGMVSLMTMRLRDQRAK
ncbi:hypothetical protein UVI_02037680 [Ustilaginoidea virens]|uniref:Chloride channel protein 3 n=1 Tax=Ustilaginoidea virens TaxID=1159556 RepID=A0A1B5KUI3_USTVR|nr:hypothetical protein UVI_02037680 [Ustilaginoidea virens]